MMRFLQSAFAFFRMDWNAFIAADMEDESQMTQEVWIMPYLCLVLWCSMNLEMFKDKL